ncbi:DNA topoisomerase I, partial [Candidatus Saccharibacteria bacterium]|nr:DNA topoisomerase I [Candidatus Saccharibacteria bacterium]
RTITLEEALEKYNEKVKAEKEKHVRKLADGLEIMKGRYGLYITDGKVNVKLPKQIDPLLAEETEIVEIFALGKNAPKKKFPGMRRGGGGRGRRG